MMTRRSFITGSAAVAMSAGICSHVMGNSAVSGNQLIYGYPPGASGSNLANALLPLLTASGGPTFRLTNKVGRNTRTASMAAAQAVPDGSCLLQALSTSLTLMPGLYKNMGFDALRDLKPVASVADFPHVLVVGPLVPSTVTTVAQYLAWVEKNPEFLDIGMSVHGSIGELAVRALVSVTGAPLRGLAYQGTDDMLADLRAQSLAAAFVVPNRSIGIDPNAPIRPIGITSAARFPFWPQVMPLAEQGVPGLDLMTWFGWFTQAATPESTLMGLRAAVTKLQMSQKYADALKNLLLISNPLSPEKITARMLDDTRRYQRLIDRFHLEKID